MDLNAKDSLDSLTKMASTSLSYILPSQKISVRLVEDKSINTSFKIELFKFVGFSFNSFAVPALLTEKYWRLGAK